MIISEQEKNRIRRLHLTESKDLRFTSVLNEQDKKWWQFWKKSKDGEKVPPLKWHKCSQDVKNINGPLLVYFNASWCGYCVKLKAKVFESNIFKQWVNENNITLLSVECRDHGPPPEGECAQKCGNDTVQGDGTNITLHFNGYVGSGMLMGDETHTWSGFPTVFLTDSNMNNIDVKVPTSFNAEEYVKELNELLTKVK